MNMLPTMVLASGGGQSIGQFLGALQKTLANYGVLIVSIIGVVMVIVGVYQLAKGLMSQGKGQTNWAVTIGLLVLGATLAISGGWSFLGTFGKNGKKTLEDMAGGTADTTSGQGYSDPFAQN